MSDILILSKSSTDLMCLTSSAFSGIATGKVAFFFFNEFIESLNFLACPSTSDCVASSFSNIALASLRTCCKLFQLSSVYCSLFTSNSFAWLIYFSRLVLSTTSGVDSFFPSFKVGSPLFSPFDGLVQINPVSGKLVLRSDIPSPDFNSFSDFLPEFISWGFGIIILTVPIILLTV